MTTMAFDPRSGGIRIHYLIIRLDDFLWFASYEWGNNNETAPILHGYALSFALGARERIIGIGGIPTYDEDLRELDVYCTPGRLLSSTGTRQRGALMFNSVEEPTQLTQALRIDAKANDPKFGRRQVLLPGLRFELVGFTRRNAVLPRVFRLGKKRSPVVIEQAEQLDGFVFEGAATPSHAVNPLDVTGRVLRCIPRSIPPHLVYERADIENDVFVRSESMFVHVPGRVRAWLSA